MDTLQKISQIIREKPGAEKLLNWEELSKIPLNDEFINEFHSYLVWDLMSQFQPFELDTAIRFEHLINFTYLEANHNTKPEVLRHFIGRMDWENVQRQQKFSPDDLNHFRAILDPLIVLQYQTELEEELIDDLLRPIVEEVVTPENEHAKWERVREYLNVVFTYQTKVTSEYVRKFLQKEAEINSNLDPDAPSSQQVILVDLKIVVTNIALTEEFMEQFCLPFREIVHEMCKSQKFTNKFIARHFDSLNIRRLVKYSNLDEDNQIRVLDRFVFRKVTSTTISAADMLKHLKGMGSTITAGDINCDDDDSVAADVVSPETEAQADKRYRVANSLVTSQVYSIELFKRIVEAFPDHENWRKILWGILYLRALVPFGDDKHMGFSPATIAMEIVPNVDWHLLAECDLTPVQIDSLIENAHQNITWYPFIKKHVMTEEQIEKLDEKGVLGAIEWWLVLTAQRSEGSELTHHFITKHKPKTKWWARITDVRAFYTKCLEALNNLDNIDGPDAPTIGSRTNLRMFLRDFVNYADWKDILKNEKLPEWFMRLFGNDQFDIDLYYWKLSRYQTELSPKFIEKNLDKLDLHTLLIYQKLELDFLANHCDFFTEEQWEIVSKNQPHTVDAIRTRAKEIDEERRKILSAVNDDE